MNRKLVELNEDINLQMETILDGINGGLVVCLDDEKFSYQYVSEAAAAIQGYEIEEFVEASNGNSMDNIYSEDQDAAMQKMSEDFAKGSRFSLTYRVVCKDRSIRWIKDDGRRVADKDGHILYYRLLQDITEQVQLERLLDSERSRYRDALTSNCKYFYSFDLTEGLIRESFTAKDGENLLQVMKLRLPVEFDAYIERWMDHYCPQFLNDDMAEVLNQQALLACFENGNTNPEVEYYSPRWKIYLRKSFLLSKNEQNGHILAFVIVTDTTSARKSEAETRQALANAYEAANRANMAKSKFLSQMSHDIRTPMNAIIGLTAIAASHIDDKERVADCLAKVTASGKHLLNLINEVLDVSKIESGRVELSEEEFSLPDLLDHLVTMMRPQLDAKGQLLNVATRNLEHENVVGDSRHLQQALLNILDNAVKYTPEKGRIDLTITEKSCKRSDAECYEFVFEDNGIGISPDFIGHIFEPFNREDHSAGNEVQGSGLGLTIAQNIVRMMGGEILVESRQGKGSRFTVTVCLMPQKALQDSYKDLIGLPVLVVDDEQDTCERACLVLSELGMKGEWVLSGQEALRKVKEADAEGKKYFAVILDWKMPDMNGVQTASELRKIVGGDVPLVILSAYDWSEIETEARSVGVDGFICKPLFRSRLAYLFRNLRDRESQEREAEEKNIFGGNDQDYTGKRVLLVEDNEINAEIAQEILESTGLTVQHAWNGKEGMDILLNGEPGYFDMVFMDVQMPVMDGCEAARAIRAVGRKDLMRIPIIAMTANAFAEDMQAVIGAGMNQHIAKPLDIAELFEVLKKWLR